MFTLYYLVNYVNARKFVVQKGYNFEKAIKTNRLGEGFKNFYWITHLNDNPADEINDLVEVVNIIKREQKQGKKKGYSNRLFIYFFYVFYHSHTN